MQGAYCMHACIDVEHALMTARVRVSQRHSDHAMHMQRETKRQRLRRELAGERAGLPTAADSQLQRKAAIHDGSDASSASVSDAEDDHGGDIEVEAEDGLDHRERADDDPAEGQLLAQALGYASA